MLSHPMTLKFWPGKEIKTNKQAKNQYKAKHNSGRGKRNFHNITLSSSQRKSIDLEQSHNSSSDWRNNTHKKQFQNYTQAQTYSNLALL